MMRVGNVKRSETGKREGCNETTLKKPTERPDTIGDSSSPSFLGRRVFVLSFHTPPFFFQFIDNFQKRRRREGLPFS